MAIVNPVSANGKTAELWPRYEAYFKKQGINLEKRFTSYPGHAIELAMEYAEDGYDRIMAVGGDGTINEVVNGLYSSNNQLINEKSRLIVFSQGTGCDYIRTLGIGNNVEDIVDIIKRDKLSMLDLGQVAFINYRGVQEKRFFVNLSDTGIGAATAKLVNESSKRLGGLLTYLLGIIRTLIVYKNREMKISIDGELKYNQVLNSLIIANGKYFGGGIKIAPEAELDSGTFNIVALKNFSKIDIIANLIRAYKGTHLSHPRVESLEASEILIESAHSLDLEVDGESLGTVPARFKVHKALLPVLI
ncbi:MAG: diacylglycerol/lipid kinase family protein [Halanaerobiaceae bacterium]